MTYDATVHHAVVKVMDNAGKLDAAVTYDGDKANAPTFTNTYTAKGSVELTATPRSLRSRRASRTTPS